MMPIPRRGHLVRRFVGSLSRRPVAAADQQWVYSNLLVGEQALWRRMSVADQRHAVVVARRFVAAAESVGRAEIAAALLHDVGKVECGLGTVARVVATVVGPRGRRFRCYHEHEQVGVRLAAAAGSEPATLALLAGRGALATVLRAADHV